MDNSTENKNIDDDELEVDTYYRVEKNGYYETAYTKIDCSVLSVRDARRARIRLLLANDLYKRTSCNYDTCSDLERDDGYVSGDTNIVLTTDDKYKTK